jgi:hypothetical protein
MTLKLDDAIARLSAAHKRQEEFASKGGDTEHEKAVRDACEDRDAILAEVIRLGRGHLAQIDRIVGRTDNRRADASESC